MHKKNQFNFLIFIVFILDVASYVFADEQIKYVQIL
jgi:hypothetical protein